MLERLTVRNYALIDAISLSFEPGFNVLSGETGAGKSILVDALSLALGGKGSGEAVRDGAEEAEVTALLRVDDNEELREWREKYGIEPEDDTLLIRRTLKSSGRGSSAVQAIPVTRAALEELAATLVDIHGQHEHQSLFRIGTHRRLLDRFAGLEERVRGFTRKFTELADLGKTLEELEAEEGRMAREAEFMRFAVDEIESAALREGEEDELAEDQRRLSRSEDLAADLERVLDGCAESREGALARLREARDALTKALDIDPSLKEIADRLESVFFELEDAVDEVRRRRDGVEYDPAELERIDDRLARIGMLRKKYGVVTDGELLAYAAENRDRLDRFEDRDEEKRRLKARKDELQGALIAEAAGISAERRKAAATLRQRTEAHLKTLGMADARFSVELEGKKNDSGRSVIGPYGTDSVEFLLSANRGESLKALKAVASGGELSRVMLAIKSVLSESDTVATMIFDEVDTGIGGEVARSVGEHLRDLSTRKQVFCITHLASIAVFADNHLQVDKETVDGRTVTRVTRVDGPERVREVARMLAGDRHGEASLDHAARLLEERGRLSGTTGAN